MNSFVDAIPSPCTLIPLCEWLSEWLSQSVTEWVSHSFGCCIYWATKLFILQIQIWVLDVWDSYRVIHSSNFCICICIWLVFVFVLHGKLHLMLTIIASNAIVEFFMGSLCFWVCCTFVYFCVFCNTKVKKYLNLVVLHFRLLFVTSFIKKSKNRPEAPPC